ncbi:cytochrome P450 9b2-like [Anopheles ziemanni]|uniref:cytochrome P450 9b2-like n=1 Tax=Anopheles coustani TaxID=139045 RepID=UPI0026593A83|nr:cytochrome P450 9b2-like [Anopheles coustani]XP_058129627.1 cytochrome P450 9b2-like [Anopheles coustani]XP_058171688.1 cytochrome P450 9b2-like [Anopheles ziemanni]
MNQEDLYWFTFILVTLLGFYTYKLLTRNRSYFRVLRVPHEKPHFMYGNLSDVLSGKLTTMEKLEQYYQKFSTHGFFGFFNYMTPALYVRDPKLIRQVLQQNMDHFGSHGYFLDENKDRFLGTQLHLVKDTEKATQMSYFLLPLFKCSTTLGGMKGMMQKNCSALVKFISSRADLELEIKAICLKHLLNVFAGCSFGKEINAFEDDSDRFCTIASGLAYGTNPVQVLKTIAFYVAPGLMRNMNVQFSDSQEIEYLVKQFQTAASEANSHSMPRVLSKANEKLANPQEQLNDEQLTAHCATFFTKGFEPTLNLLSFAIYELAQNQQVQSKLYDEIKSKASSGDTSIDCIRSLPYLEAIVKETLRKWPPHPLLVRECTKPFTIPASENGDRAAIPLKVGDKVYVSVWALHRNEEYYPEPEQFRPERCFGGDGTNAPANTFIPFGIGRGCLGQEFVKMVVMASLVSIVQRFKLTPGERTSEPLKLIETGSSVEARDGLWIRLEPRHK